MRCRSKISTYPTTPTATRSFFPITFEFSATTLRRSATTRFNDQAAADVDLVDQAAADVDLVDQAAADVDLVDQAAADVDLVDQAAADVDLVDQAAADVDLVDQAAAAFFLSRLSMDDPARGPERACCVRLQISHCIRQGILPKADVRKQWAWPDYLIAADLLEERGYPEAAAYFRFHARNFH